jgi:hypothetical protein
MATNDSKRVVDNLAAVSVSRASGAVLLAEAARGAGVSAWAPSCAPWASPVCIGFTLCVGRMSRSHVCVVYSSVVIMPLLIMWSVEAECSSEA